MRTVVQVKTSLDKRGHAHTLVITEHDAFYPDAEERMEQVQQILARAAVDAVLRKIREALTPHESVQGIEPVSPKA